MAQQAGFNVRITGDGAQAKAEMNSVSSAASSGAQAIAAAYSSVAVSVRVATSAVNTFKAAMGLWSQVLGAVSHLVSLVGKAVDFFRNLGKASEEAMASAAKFAERAKDSGLDASLFDAVAEAAGKAGVAADELAEKLKQFKDFKITFVELAAAIGSSGEELKEIARAFDRNNVGSRFLADEAARTGREKEAAERAGNEAEGRRALVAALSRAGDNGNGAESAAIWDRIMEWAQGDRSRAESFFEENKPWWMFRNIGALGFGTQGLDAAEARYADRERGRREARDRELAEQAAKVEAERRAAAEKEAAKAAEEAAAEEKRIAEEKRREAEAARKAAEAAQREADRKKAAHDRNVDQYQEAMDAALKYRDDASASITVSAPQVISEYARRGGMLGGDSAGDNLRRMAEERNRKLTEIEARFREMLDKAQKHYDANEKALNGG